MSPPAPRNRTLSCDSDELLELSGGILRIDGKIDLGGIAGQVIGGDFFDIAKHLPRNFVDLLILDPPYNLTKDFNGNCFRKLDRGSYASWFDRVMTLVDPLMKPNGTLYVCSDWKTSAIVLPVLEDHFLIRNRITWEREKGRGAKSNWKNNTEDIWFCTKSNDYYFNVDSVMMKRRVLAPYRKQGKPKDWMQESDGNYRLTYPSNIWTDLTVPFWSMPENTPHPAQKPEKLFAKLLLASSRENDFVFDPFLGSGTSAVVAEKLGRRWSGIDINTEYLCWARKRIQAARKDSNIQGYRDGVFWERNSDPDRRKRARGKMEGASTRGTLFP